MARLPFITPRILCVDGDQERLDLFCLVLRDKGFTVRKAKSGAEALLRMHLNLFDALLVDNELPDVKAEVLIESIRQSDPTTPIIVYSGDALKKGDRRLNLGVPISPIEPAYLNILLPILNYILEQNQMKKVEAFADTLPHDYITVFQSLT